MKVALLVSTLGFALIALLPAVRRLHPSSKVSDAEYFAAARKRALQFRLSKAASHADMTDAGG